MKLKVFGCKTNGYFARRWIEETDLYFYEKMGQIL